MKTVKKLTHLNVKDKVKIIEAVNNNKSGKTKKDIAAEFGIPCSTLSTILKNQEGILKQFSSGHLMRKRLTHDG